MVASKYIVASLLPTNCIVIEKSLSKIPLILVREVLIAASTFVFLSASLASEPSKKKLENSAVVATASLYFLKEPSLVCFSYTLDFFLTSASVSHSKSD